MQALRKNPQPRTIVVRGDQEYTLEGVSLHLVLPEKQKALKRFVDVVRTASNSITVRQARTLTVGRITLGPYLIIVPPPMSAAAFVNFVLYALQGDIRRYHPDESSGVLIGDFRSDLFLQLMAALLVHHSEHLLRGHLSKSYVPNELHTKTLKGNVLWAKNFGRHPAEGIVCRTFELVTDEPLNRLVFAGLDAAARILHGTKDASAAATQLFVWRQIARGCVPTDFDFERAEQRISRLTEHYRPALTLSRAITLGFAPRDLVTTGSASLNHLEFYIPLLFESFLVRLLTPYAAKCGLRLKFKLADRRALRDGKGQLYREIEPDIVVLRRDIPVGVIDAKFKPRYVTRKSDDCDEPLAKVTNADIYQLFFYQSRLQALSGLKAPPRAAIIAPSSALDTNSIISREKRTILWAGGMVSSENQPTLTVLPAPLEAVLTLLRYKNEIEVLETCMPEVASEMRMMGAVTH